MNGLNEPAARYIMHSSSKPREPMNVTFSRFGVCSRATGVHRSSARHRVSANAGVNFAQTAAVPSQCRPMPENIAAYMAPACASVSARNSVKPSTTTSSVYSCPIRFPLSLSTGIAPQSSSTENKPCHSPQRTNVQLAPCHSPVAKNTRKRLNHVRAFPFRLPPSGIYR